MSYHMLSVRDRLEGTGFSRLQRLALNSRSSAPTKYEIILKKSSVTSSTQGGVMMQVRKKSLENLGKSEEWGNALCGVSGAPANADGNA